MHGELEALEDGVRRLDAQALRSLQGEVATLHKLVDDLHELSLADVGALSYRKTDLDLRTLIDGTAGAFRERINGSGLALQLELPDQPLPAFGDERRLRQLFSNLLENSCRYTEAGGALRISARREGAHAVIDVQDSAPGVTPEQLPRLFERFFRAEASRSRRSGGAGLGLSICQRIVQAHEGRIEARPSPLGGLWLRVELPSHG
ncbi:MAG: ATP-binding protein, partial [Roseateles sp.]